MRASTMKRRRATTMGVNLCGCGASDFDTFFSCSIKRGILACGASYGRLRFVSRYGGEPVESINRKTEKGFASRYGEPLQVWGFLKALTDFERRFREKNCFLWVKALYISGVGKPPADAGLAPPCERAEMDSPLRVWGFLLPADPAVALIGENPTDAGLPAARCQRRSRQGGTPCGAGFPASILPPPLIPIPIRWGNPAGRGFRP